MACVRDVADCVLVGPLVQLGLAALSLLRTVSRVGVRAAAFDGIAAHMAFNPDDVAHHFDGPEAPFKA